MLSVRVLIGSIFFTLNLIVEPEEELEEEFPGWIFEFSGVSLQRCVFLTFTVTLITTWGFPTLLHLSDCTFNNSKHTKQWLIVYPIKSQQVCDITKVMSVFLVVLRVLILPFFTTAGKVHKLE